MNPTDETDILVKFLNGRKSKTTKNATIGIIRYLSHAKNTNNEGWVRARELQNYFVKTGNLSDSTLFRLLNDMVKTGLISRDDSKIEYTERSYHGKKKPSVYYRTEIDWENSRWEKYAEIMSDVARCYAKLDLAFKMLQELGVKNPKDELEKRFDDEYGIKSVFNVVFVE